MNGIYLRLSLVSDHYSWAVYLLTVLIHPGLECLEKSLYHIVLLHLSQKEGNRDTKFSFSVLDNNSVQVCLSSTTLDWIKTIC